VQLVLEVLTRLERRRLARQLQALVKVWEVELDDEDGVGESVVFAQLFELFG
jgi:hypothetical protein